MEKKHLVIVAIFALALAGLAARAFHFKVTQSGELIFLEQGFSRSTLKVDQKSERSVYLIVGEALGGREHYQAVLPVVPMGTVQELNELHGDFRKCKAPGADSARSKVIYLKISIGNDANHQKLQNLVALSKKPDPDTLVVFEAHKFSVIEKRSFSRRNRALESLPGPEIFVSSIEIEKLIPATVQLIPTRLNNAWRARVAAEMTARGCHFQC